MDIEREWIDFKDVVSSKNLQMQYIILDDKYQVWADEGNVNYFCRFRITNPALSGSDQEDFENNYLGNCNRPVANKISEDKAGTGGNFQMRGIKLTVPANGSNFVEVSWPFPVRLFAIFLVPPNDGDEAEGVIAEHTVTGTITADIAAGDTQITVDDTTKDNLKTGFAFRLTDGTNTEDFIVTAIAGNNISLDHAVINTYSPATPTYCKMSVKMSYDKVPLQGGYMCECGGSALGGSFLQAGTKFKLTYYNNSAAEVDVYYKLEYWY